MAREKKVVSTGSPLQVNVEEEMRNYAMAEAQLAELKAQMEQEILDVRERYAVDMSQLEAAKKKAFEQLNAYALIHYDEFADKRSRSNAYGEFGFRLGNPTLNKPASLTWAVITQNAEALAPEFVKTKKDLDKAGLLAIRHEHPEILKALKLSVTQDETFYVDPKLELAA